MKLTVNKVSKSFGEKQVLSDVSFTAQSGRALGILGRNGAGKTTTIRIIMDVFDADCGSILLDDKSLKGQSINIGYMPEERGLYPKKLIMQQLLYFAALKGVESKTAKKSAQYWLKRLGMEEYANKKLDTLSKGNQQKIQLVVTLISNPDIVILDEPFSGLDPVNAMLLKDIVKELINNGKIVLFSSHQMNYIEEFCNDIVILNQGKIVLSGDLQQIKRSYDRSKIVVNSASAEEVERFAESLEFVSGPQKTQQGLLIGMKGEHYKGQLLQRLAEQSFDIDEFKVFEPSLNDIFVQYTENAI